MIGGLRYRNDFQALRRDGQTVRRGLVRVVYRPSDDLLGGVRVAFAISREVGNAVVRNRVRRRLRPLMSELAARADGLPAGDYLVGVDRRGANADSSKLLGDLVAVGNDLRIQNKKSI